MRAGDSYGTGLLVAQMPKQFQDGSAADDLIVENDDVAVATSPINIEILTSVSLSRSFAPAAMGTPSLLAKAAALLAFPRSGDTTTPLVRS